MRVEQRDDGCWFVTLLREDFPTYRSPFGRKTEAEALQAGLDLVADEHREETERG